MEREVSENSPLIRKKSIMSISPKLTSVYIEQEVIENKLLQGEWFTKQLTKKGLVDMQKSKQIWLKVELYPLSIQYEYNREDIKTIKFESIDEIRMGQEYATENEDRVFSIIYKLKGKHKELSLLASSQESCVAWVYGLYMLLTQREDSTHDLVGFPTFMLQMWKTVDVENKGALDIAEIEKLVTKLHLPLSKSELHSAFKVLFVKSISRKTKEPQLLQFDQFSRFYRNLKFRPEINRIFSALCQKHYLYMSLNAFESFVLKVQKEIWTEQKIIESFSKFSGENSLGMDMDHFSAYLVSNRNGAVNKKRSMIVNQNMDRPLNEYYINSSHNTYLLGDQIASESSVEGYIRALRRGCKCVELDCWDGINGQPVIYHGRTLTSKITFRDVVTTIKKYAFVASDFPVILSLETHCSVEQQVVMKSILVEILGDLLLREPIMGLPPKTLPSPKQLLNKILLKGKVFGEEGDVESLTEASSDSGVRVEPGKAKKVTISPELASLVYYVKGKSSKKLEVLPGKLKYDQLYSFTDRKAAGFLQKQPEELKELVKNRLLRIYPSVMRLNSSNYNPIQYWDAGVQMTALNFQTLGLPMELNDALFDLNGACGYVLKTLDSEPKYQKIFLEIISAQQVHKPDMNSFLPVRCYVQVDLICPDIVVTQKTPSNRSITLNPLFHESFEFEIKNTALSFFKFQVFGADDQYLIGSFVVHSDLIMEGYRHIPLNDRNGDRIGFSSIFVRISKS